MSLPSDITALKAYVEARANKFPASFVTIFTNWNSTEEYHREAILADFHEYFAQLKPLTTESEIALLVQIENQKITNKYSIYV